LTLQLRALSALFVFSVSLFADSIPEGDAVRPNEMIQRYVSAVENGKETSEDVSMSIEIEAKLPRLKKSGKLHALRFVSKLGQIVYRGLQFEGDDMVKKDVIARYLTAEKEARSDYSGSIAITPENYKFRYKGTTDYAGDTAYVFQVTPKKKRVGLFKGELWIDSKTYLPLREWGELVKNPSVFLKNVYFVRDYFVYDGRSIPRRIISDVDTRLIGKAQLTIWFDNYSLGVEARSNEVLTSEAHPVGANGVQAR
jgi:hypothetical protein